MVLDVLRGELSEAVLCRSAETLSVFGIGRAFSLRAWQAVLRQLFAMGYLEIDPAQVIALRISLKAERALRHKETIPIFSHLLPSQPQRRSAMQEQATTNNARKPYQPVDLTDLAPDGKSRFDALRQWRTEMAKAADVPAYIVMQNATAKTIAQTNPSTLDALALIPGIGPSRLDKYGEGILRVLGGIASTD